MTTIRIISETDILDGLLPELGGDEVARAEMRELVPVGDKQVAADELEVGDALDAWKSKLNSLICEQIDEVLQHEKVKQARAAWSAIEASVEDPLYDADTLSMFLLVASKTEIVRDLARNGWNYENTLLFDMLVRQCSGVFGGDPLLAVVADVEIAPTIEDIKLADVLAWMGKYAHMPFIFNASPKFYKVEKWSDLSRRKR